MLEFENPAELSAVFFCGLPEQKSFDPARRYEIQQSLINRSCSKTIDIAGSHMSFVSIPDAVAVKIAGQCGLGKVRQENQDTVRHTSTALGDLLVVADGMSDFPGGGEASQMAVDTISANVEGMPAFFPPEIAVEEAMCNANAAIAAISSEPDSPHSGMGTTAVVALLRTASDGVQAPMTAIIGHVGDSRAYLLHNKKLSQITQDHSVVQDLLDSNQITAEEAKTSLILRC
jgi:serine/threonine protein phosphatase PrpC